VDDPSPKLRLSARVRLFGYAETEAELSAVPRSTRWRLVKAMKAGGAGYALMLLTPLPPHLGWLLGGFGAGTWFGLRRWRERFTLLELSGSCPRCQGELNLPRPVRLQSEMPLDCEGCGHAASVVTEIPCEGPGVPT